MSSLLTGGALAWHESPEKSEWVPLLQFEGLSKDSSDELDSSLLVSSTYVQTNETS